METINQIQAIEIIKEELNDHTKGTILEDILNLLGINDYIIKE